MANKSKKSKKRNIVVEVPLSGGYVSMFVGELVSETESRITLANAAWIGNTGRRHMFFDGTPDTNIEIEPYPDGVEIALPAQGAVITTWPHPLLRKAI